jgi:hypothetical protein
MGLVAMIGHPRLDGLPAGAVERAQDKAAELANDLAQLAKERDDGQLAKLATDCACRVHDIHLIAETIAVLIGEPRHLR